MHLVTTARVERVLAAVSKLLSLACALCGTALVLAACGSARSPAITPNQQACGSRGCAYIEGKVVDCHRGKHDCSPLHVEALSLLASSGRLVASLSNFSGTYRLPAPTRTGRYRLILRADRQVLRRHVRLATGRTSTVNFVLVPRS